MKAISLFSRIKTVHPDATCSGQSWDDYKCRMDDVGKFEIINNHINEKIDDIIELKNSIDVYDLITTAQDRHIPMVDLKNFSFYYATHDHLKEIIKKKYDKNSII